MNHENNSTMGLITYILKNINNIRSFMLLTRTRAMLVRANMELGKLGYKDDIFAQRVNEFNHAMILYSKGKWYMDRGMNTGSKNDWRQAFRDFKRTNDMAERLYNLLISHERTPVELESPSLVTGDTEVLFADGVPLVPEINPVVVLMGSDFDMGYQYARQVIKIFGQWIFKRKAGRRFPETEMGYIKEWENQIRQYAPEILSMCQGWAQGATDAGVPMSYYDVLEMWTDHSPPAYDYLKKGSGLQQIASPLCSGAAAWGKATTDHRLVTGSTGDHDPAFMVTIAAFPETGNNFIITPFSVIGDVPLVGPVYMMGHPGMNNKGLAYVEHGGEMRMIEPKGLWGYGIRRGTSVFHILRFANSAREARQMELSYPIGDVGCAMGSVGGFYADSSYGYVLESRKEPLAIREAGLMGETDFLFATNNAMHPESGKAEWMQKHKENWAWDLHGGWHPKEFIVPELFSFKRKKTNTDRIHNALSHMYNNSLGRNLYLFDMLDRSIGHIDLEYMKALYRTSGTIPEGTWKEITSNYKHGGKWGRASAGHAGNALVTVMKPDDGNEGIYALCVNEATRGLTPNLPNPNSGPTYGETNAFWELKLAASPGEMADAAMQKAVANLDAAAREIGKLQESDIAGKPLSLLLKQAKTEFEAGIRYRDASAKLAGNDFIFGISQAIRAFTRSQVRALQVYQALVPPQVLHSTEDFRPSSSPQSPV